MYFSSIKRTHLVEQTKALRGQGLSFSPLPPSQCYHSAFVHTHSINFTIFNWRSYMEHIQKLDETYKYCITQLHTFKVKNRYFIQ